MNKKELQKTVGAILEDVSYPINVQVTKRRKSDASIRYTTFRGRPCIEINCVDEVNPIDLDLPKKLEESYRIIAQSVFRCDKFEFDERDEHTMWIWKK